MTKGKLQETVEADDVEVINETPVSITFKSFYGFMDGSHIEALNTYHKKSGRIDQKVLDNAL